VPARTNICNFAGTPPVWRETCPEGTSASGDQGSPAAPPRSASARGRRGRLPSGPRRSRARRARRRRRASKAARGHEDSHEDEMKGTRHADEGTRHAGVVEVLRLTWIRCGSSSRLTWLPTSGDIAGFFCPKFPRKTRPASDIDRERGRAAGQRRSALGREHRPGTRPCLEVPQFAWTRGRHRGPRSAPSRGDRDRR
jgi:hypothetical protein